MPRWEDLMQKKNKTLLDYFVLNCINMLGTHPQLTGKSPEEIYHTILMRCA